MNSPTVEEIIDHPEGYFGLSEQNIAALQEDMRGDPADRRERSERTNPISPIKNVIIRAYHTGNRATKRFLANVDITAVLTFLASCAVWGGLALFIGIIGGLLWSINPWLTVLWGLFVAWRALSALAALAMA